MSKSPHFANIFSHQTMEICLLRLNKDTLMYITHFLDIILWMKAWRLSNEGNMLLNFAFAFNKPCT